MRSDFAAARECSRSGRAEQALDFAARVDDGAAHRLGAPDERAILLIRRDGNDLGLEGRLAHGHFETETVRFGVEVQA